MYTLSKHFGLLVRVKTVSYKVTFSIFQECNQNGYNSFRENRHFCLWGPSEGLLPLGLKRPYSQSTNLWRTNRIPNMSKVCPIVQMLRSARTQTYRRQSKNNSLVFCLLRARKCVKILRSSFSIITVLSQQTIRSGKNQSPIFFW